MVESVEQVRSTFDRMKSHYKGGFSYTEQQYIEKIYMRLFSKPMPKRVGCQDCYRDAFIIISNKLNTITEMPKESIYKLKAGVVASSFGSSDFYVLDMPEEAAEKWLHEFPERINQFQKFPEDWQKRVEDRFAEADPEIQPENAPESTNVESNNEDTNGNAEKPRRGRKPSNNGI